jgi:hypothetical protein
MKGMFTLARATTFAGSEKKCQGIDLRTAALLRQSRDSFEQPHRAANAGAGSMSGYKGAKRLKICGRAGKVATRHFDNALRAMV